MNWNDRKGSQLRLKIRSSDYYDHPIFMAFMHLYTVYHTHVSFTWPQRDPTWLSWDTSILKESIFSRKVWFWGVQKWFSTRFRQSWAFLVKKHFCIKQWKIEVIRGLSMIISWWLCTLCHVKIELIKIYPTIRTIKIPWFFHFLFSAAEDYQILAYFHTSLASFWARACHTASVAIWLKCVGVNTG